MVTQKDFERLMAILPQLEAFVKKHQLFSLSFVKNTSTQKESDLYLFYTYPGEVLGAFKGAHLGRDFKKLWGVAVDSGALLAKDKITFDPEIYEEHLKKTEFILVSVDSNQNYITATAEQVAEYANREFGITIQPSVISDLSDHSQKRRLSDDEKMTASQSSSITSNNLFTQVSSQNSESNIAEEVKKLSLDECRQYLISMSEQFGVNSLIQIRPIRK
jgi:hypothetical protein